MDKTARFLKILVALVEAESAARNFGPVIPKDRAERLGKLEATLDIFNDFCANEITPECLEAVREFYALVEKRDVYGNRSKLFKEYLNVADK